MTIRREFRAMGTDCVLVLDTRGPGAKAERALDQAVAEVERIEQMASRFRRHSELSRLNTCGMAVASPDLLDLIAVALDMRGETDGLFDPTMHDALVGLGYDRSFELLADRAAPAAPPAPVGSRHSPAPREVIADPRTRTVRLGPGARLDLGGIAKGWAADRVAASLREHGPCLVSLGGDIAVAGRRGRSGWPIEVEHAQGMRTIGLTAGGMATSGTGRRRWRRGGAHLHHVLHPATGLPSATDLRQVTVVAATSARAEAWATALLVAGSRTARALARRHDLTTVMLTAAGRTITTGDLATPNLTESLS